MLTPTKIVQYCSNFQPYMDDELRELGNQVKLKFNLQSQQDIIMIGMIIIRVRAFIKRL